MLTPSQQRHRDRLVLFEADKLDDLYHRIWEAKRGHFPKFQPPHLLTPEEVPLYPDLAQKQRDGKQVHCGRRDPQPLIKRLFQMRAAGGPLALSRMNHPHLDHLSLFKAADRANICSGSKRAVTGFLGVHGKGVKAITAVIERGCISPTHTHSLVNVSGLSSSFRDALHQAPQGPGGGVMYRPGVHAVLVGDTDDDLIRLGIYLSKFADQRAVLRNDHPAHLAMLNERAESLLHAADRSISKLAWHTRCWQPGERLQGAR